MSFPSVEAEKAVVIRKLPDQPSNQGMNAEQLKVAFDGGATNLLQAMNQLIAALNSPTAAENLGFYGTAGVQAANVQAAIENVQSQIKEISQGAVADGSITTDKLDDDAVTTPKILDMNVTTPKIADSAITTVKLADHSVTMDKLAGVETGWRKLLKSEFDIVDTDNNVKYLQAYYHEFLGIVRFVAKIRAQFYSVSGGDRVSVFYNLSGSHIPLVDQDALQADDYWVPAYGSAYAYPGYSSSEVYYANIGYQPDGWGHLLRIEGPIGEKTLYVSGFYCVGVVTSGEEGS